ncbi:unnamed protein product [Mycena citricolor]|uniref:Holocytochrome c-type synthase n=1 Tax=Mycena citricolor TaxID=2018698 RepID=A0AAD2GYG8_9AGAR|nr:unnamed protein product [Mycena citricolor]
MSCPVDHSQVKKEQSTDAAKCPVDHSPSSQSKDSSASVWSRLFSSGPTPSSSTPETTTSILSTERDISSIPRAGTSENWVYPSQAQFFSAMERKKHDPQAADMRTIVPIHNAVNERAWGQILEWESLRDANGCTDGPQLVTFKGRAAETDRSPRAKARVMMGYTAPFDRHDWIVDRCGIQMRYVIDFYTGKSTGPNAGPSFYLDVRPALDSWEGARMRMQRFWGGLLGFGPSSQIVSKA